MTAILALGTLAAAVPGGLAPTRAKAATEYDSLVQYWPAGKLKVGKRIFFRFVCASDCQVTVRSKLILPGPDPRPVVDTAIFSAGAIGMETLRPPKSIRSIIASHLRSSKLRTSITATTQGGLTDRDTQTFHFKR